MKVKVGMKVKGFKFESRKHNDIAYHPDMDQYEGVVGVIGRINTNSCRIDFDGDYWFYPKEVIHRAFLSVGDKVKIPKTKSAGQPLSHCEAILRAKKKGQDYLYYTGEYDGKLILDDECDENTGEHFTLEDIELYEQEKQNKMEIKKSELKKIHDVACSTWKNKIEALASRNPFGDSIELTQGEIDEMFKAAANSKQTKVLEEVFGKQNKGINLCSEDINHTVDGLPVFGGSNLDVSEALIGLPRQEVGKNKFFLNPKYNWELKDERLIVTRK